MQRKTINRRGLQSLRTHTSKKANGCAATTELYIKLTVLEMEKSRRLSERSQLQSRIDIVNARLKDIDREQTAIHASTTGIAKDSQANAERTAVNTPAAVLRSSRHYTY